MTRQRQQQIQSRRAAVALLFAGGSSVSQCAAQVGVSVAVASRDLKALGISTKGRPRGRPSAEFHGRKFGLWTALHRTDAKHVLCKCECGTVQQVQVDSLARGRSTRCRACGYVARKAATAARKGVAT